MFYTLRARRAPGAFGRMSSTSVRGRGSTFSRPSSRTGQKRSCTTKRSIRPAHTCPPRWRSRSPSPSEEQPQ